MAFFRHRFGCRFSLLVFCKHFSTIDHIFPLIN
jgi:hypothetical protein